MRIALISYEYPPHWHGGIGNYTRQAALMLKRRGHDVEVFAASPERAYNDRPEGVKVNFGRCIDRWQFAQVAAEMFARRHAEEPFDVLEVPELAAEGRDVLERFPEVPSVVRLHTPAYLAAWVDLSVFGQSAVLLQSLRYGLAELVRGRWPRNGIGFWRGHSRLNKIYQPETDEERRVALLADVSASPSARLAEQVTGKWRLDKGSVRVVPYPHQPDPDLLLLSPPEGPLKTICFYGGIKAFKGVDVLARAIPKVLKAHPNVRFVFAGPSQRSPIRDISLRAFIRGAVCDWQDMGEWMKRELSSFGGAIELRGPMDRAGIAALLAEADLCVFPSRFDNFPNACLEAMAAARPIVATRSGGMEEMLGPTNCGVLVKPGNADELARAIIRLADDPEQMLSLALRARQRVLEAYGDEAVGPLYEELYSEAGKRCGMAHGSTRCSVIGGRWINDVSSAE